MRPDLAPAGQPLTGEAYRRWLDTASDEQRRELGRAEFDAAGYRDGSCSPWEPNDREQFARAYAEIARPFGSKPAAIVAQSQEIAA